MHEITNQTPLLALKPHQRRRFLSLGLGLGALASGMSLSGCSLLSTKKPIVGLVLGAGAARGFAHVGVIKALEAQGIRASKGGSENASL